jgi:hypothetical protein
VGLAEDAQEPGASHNEQAASSQLLAFLSPYCDVY